MSHEASDKGMEQVWEIWENKYPRANAVTSCAGLSVQGPP